MEAAMIPAPMALTDPLAEEMDAWLAGEGLATEAPAHRVERDLWIDQRLYALREIEREIGHQQEVFGRRIEMVRSRLVEVVTPLERRAAHLRAILEHEAAVYEYPKGKKSITLPSGKIGGRASAETLKIEDSEAALDFAKRTDGLTEEIITTERINLTPLKKYFQATGEIPPGCEFVPASVRYYVETAEEG